MFFTARTPKIKAEDVHTLSNPVIAEKSNGFGIPGTEGGAALLWPDGASVEIVPWLPSAAADFPSEHQKNEN